MTATAAQRVMGCHVIFLPLSWLPPTLGVLTIPNYLTHSVFIAVVDILHGRLVTHRVTRPSFAPSDLRRYWGENFPAMRRND